MHTRSAASPSVCRAADAAAGEDRHCHHQCPAARRSDSHPSSYPSDRRRSASDSGSGSGSGDSGGARGNLAAYSRSVGPFLHIGGSVSPAPADAAPRPQEEGDGGSEGSERRNGDAGDDAPQHRSRPAPAPEALRHRQHYHRSASGGARVNTPTRGGLRGVGSGINVPSHTPSVHALASAYGYGAVDKNADRDRRAARPPPPSSSAAGDHTNFSNSVSQRSNLSGTFPYAGHEWGTPSRISTVGGDGEGEGEGGYAQHTAVARNTSANTGSGGGWAAAYVSPYAYRRAPSASGLASPQGAAVIGHRHADPYSTTTTAGRSVSEQQPSSNRGAGGPTPHRRAPSPSMAGPRPTFASLARAVHGREERRRSDAGRAPSPHVASNFSANASASSYHQQQQHSLAAASNNGSSSSPFACRPHAQSDTHEAGAGYNKYSNGNGFVGVGGASAAAAAESEVRYAMHHHHHKRSGQYMSTHITAADRRAYDAADACAYRPRSPRHGNQRAPSAPRGANVVCDTPMLDSVAPAPHSVSHAPRPLPM